MSGPKPTKVAEKEPTEIQVVQLMAPIEQLKRSLQDFEKLKAELLTDDDWQRIGDRKFITRSGFRKIALAFGLSDRILEEVRVDRADESFVWRIRVRVWAKNGRRAEAVGACDSRERGFAHLEHDAYATAHTRAKSRAISDLVAGGAVSAEEIEVEQAEAPKPEKQATMGPLRKDVAQPKQEAEVVRRFCTGNQRALITVKCTAATQIAHYDVLETMLIKYGKSHLEQLAFDQAEAMISELDSIIEGRR